MKRCRSSCEWKGAYEQPSMPMTSVVTPWRTLGSWRGSDRIISPEWAWKSIKPGHTTCPVGIDHARRFDGRDVPAHDAHALAVDADRGVEAGAAGAVDNQSAANQQVKRQ